MRKNWVLVFAAVTCAALAGCATIDDKPRQAGLDHIEHIVVIYAENHSFDNMYGMFPGANGVANATAEQMIQLDHDGKPLPHLPPVFTAQGKPDPRYPQSMPNGPFRIDAPPVNARIDQVVPSPIHAYYQNIEQINGGRNNQFVAMTTVGAWTMGYYDGSSQKVWQWAREYTLADNSTAFVHRGALMSAEYDVQLDDGVTNATIDDALVWSHGLRTAMAPWSSGRAYVNYVDPLIDDWKTAYYGDNYTRLVQVKTKYDPTNIFKFAQGIPANG